MLQNESTSSSLRAKMGSFHLLRTQDADTRILNKDQASAFRNNRFLRWTACFTFGSKFKKPKSKTECSTHASFNDSLHTTSDTDINDPELEMPVKRQSLSEDERSSIANSIHQWNPPSFTASALSPPPRQKKERGYSMVCFPREPLLMIERSREKALRLSLEVDHRLSGASYCSSVISTDSGVMTQRDEYECGADTASSICTSKSLAGLNSARASSLITLARKRGSQRYSVSSCPQNEIFRPLTRTTSTPDPSLASPLRVKSKSPPSSLIQALPFATPVARMPVKERRRFTEGDRLTVPLEDEDEDYNDLLDKFQLPVDFLSDKGGATDQYSDKDDKYKMNNDARRCSIALSRQQAMQALVGHWDPDVKPNAKSMDVTRDKAYYDAVVTRTLQHKACTPPLDDQKVKESKHTHLKIFGGKHTKVRLLKKKKRASFQKDIVSYSDSARPTLA